MQLYIVGFCKTEHFSYRQWDRKINDSFLCKILKNVDKNLPNTLLIISRKILKNISQKSDEELFIKVDKDLLITCFYCKFHEYSSIKRDQNYLIINKL